MSNPRTNIVFAGPFEVLHGYPPRSCLSHDHSCALTLPASSRRGPLETVLRQADRAEYELFDYFYTN